MPALAAAVAIVGATLIDGNGQAPVRASTVVIDAGRIVAAGFSGSIAVPPDAVQIDAHGKWLLPGLVDAHAHFFQ